MSRSALFALLAVIVLLIGATAVIFQRYRNTSADYAESQTHYNEAISAIAEIQDSLYAITPRDSTVAMLAQGLQAEQKLTEPQTQQALERIALINGSIQRTKGKIRELEANLTKSGVKIAGLQRMIGNLKQTVAEKEEQVGQLAVRVDSLQNRVTGLETDVQASQETIRERDLSLEEKRRELATIYYVVGTRKELTTAGVVVAKGGFLGLGKTVQLSGRFDESLFTPLDTDQERLVHAPSAKVQVLSAQPTSSYELALGADQTDLHIVDTQQFRKVKHLVIMTR
jgi:peptidoglycan hydrolase CwlO-like protein